MSITETQKLLNSDVTNYSFQEEWSKNRKEGFCRNISSLLSATCLFPLIPITIFKIVRTNDDNMVYIWTNFYLHVARSLNGYFLVTTLSEKYNLKNYKFDVRIPKKDKIDFLKQSKFQADLGIGLCVTMIAINSIYLMALNSYYKFQ